MSMKRGLGGCVFGCPHTKRKRGVGVDSRPREHACRRHATTNAWYEISGVPSARCRLMPEYTPHCAPTSLVWGY